MPTDRKREEAESTAQDQPAKARREYRAPQLRRLGSVRDLTLALSGAPMEGLAGGMMAM
jgi:hypothetical protein